MSTNHSETVSLRPDVVATVLEEGAALLDLETKYFYSVNSSGWAIIQMFELGSTTKFVFEQCRELGAGTVDEPYIHEFVQLLIDEKLITPSEEEPVLTRLNWEGAWINPLIEKNKEPLQRLISSAFDPTMPLAE